MKLRVFLLFCFFGVVSTLTSQVLELKETKKDERGKISTLTAEDAKSGHADILLYAKWAEFENAYRNGRASEEEKLLSEMVFLRTASEIPGFTELALAAIQFGKAELSQKHADRALTLFRAAAELDPSLPSAFYSQGQAHLAKGIGGLFPAINAAIKGMFAPLATMSGRIYFTSKYALVLTFSLILIGFVFAFAVLLKYVRLLFHDVLEKYSQRFDPDLLRLAFLIFLFLPLLLFVGPLWLAPYWLAILWGYCRYSERILSILFFVVFIFVYPVYKGVLEVSYLLQRPSISNYVHLFSEGPSTRLLSDFEQYSADHPEDQDASIILAYLYKTGERFVPAIGILQKHINQHPSDARAYNNLAIVYFLQGELDTALGMNEKAANLDSRNAIYPYNLAHLNRARFNFQDADRLLSRARTIDPEFVKSVEGDSSFKLTDALPTSDLVWQRIDKVLNLPSLLFNPFSLFSLALFFGMLFFHLGKKKKRGFAKECIKCGKPFCKKCQPSDKEARFCTQCMHIFIRKDGVSPLSRKEKMIEIEKYTKKQELFLRLSSLILPGFGSLLRNQVLVGILFLILWFLFLTLVFFNSFFSDLWFLEPSENLRVVTLACICAMTLTYIAANAFLLRKSKSAGTV